MTPGQWFSNFAVIKNHSEGSLTRKIAGPTSWVYDPYVWDGEERTKNLHFWHIPKWSDAAKMGAPL